MSRKPPNSVPPRNPRPGASRPDAAAQIDTLRGLVRRYRRTAVAAVLVGEAKATVGFFVIDTGDVLWWANLGWAAALLTGGGYLAAPHLKRLAQLSDPARPPRV
ncbi:hypothetical protein [Catellatospora vulcania]|uniref:hypothetical protein n=1 Tax=Catellatospora vulcania TaxID=1460450 RepID=UPI0012D47D9E|nr:hypothetical protein [Catellatospora vulcania]